MAESQEKFVRTMCPRCGSHLKAPAARVGRRLPCPKCGHEIEVAAGTSFSPLRESHTYVAPPAGDDEYALKDMTYAVREPPPGEHSGLVIPVADVPDEFSVVELSADESFSEEEGQREGMALSERPKLPPRPMIDGVLTFFVQTTAIVCWSGFSVTAVVVLYAMNLSAKAATASQFGPVATFLMGLIAIVIAVVGLISMTGFLMAILQDSAAGNRVIVHWPDLVFVDWVGGAVYFFVSLVVPFGVMYLLAWPFGGVFAHGWLVPIGLWLLFPVVLLSTLEMQSPLAPVSPIVLQSLSKCFRTWIVFYFETCLMGLGLALLAAVVLLLVPNLFGFAVLAGAAVATAMLYFRLLGRLTWVCDEHFRQEEVEEEEEEEGEEVAEDDESPPIPRTPVDDF